MNKPFNEFDFSIYGFYYCKFDFFIQKKEECYYWHDMEGFWDIKFFIDEFDDV